MLSKPLVSDPAAQPANLATHFEAVLNIPKEVQSCLIISHLNIGNRLCGKNFWRHSQLAVGKACGSAGIYAELLCALLSFGDGIEILQQLHRMIYAFGQGRVPSEKVTLWKISNLFALYKGKGDYTDLQNWRGVILLDIDIIY